MTREIRKHALAEIDLFEIWEYTFREWDAAQADKHLDELDDGIRQLADNPEMGARRDYVRQGCRVLFINSHAIYYAVATSASNRHVSGARVLVSGLLPTPVHHRASH